MTIYLICTCIRKDNNDNNLLIKLHFSCLSLGPEVVMYTTDGAGDGYLRCGSIEDAYTTVDFGPGANITKAFNVQRHFQPHGPLVNSEFYPGTVYNFATFCSIQKLCLEQYAHFLHLR